MKYFYVEVVYDADMNRILKLTSFKGLDLLEQYLEAIELKLR